MEEYKIITRKEAKLLGLKRYFTGAQCRHGHIAERKVSTGECIACKLIRTQIWRNKPEEDKYLNKKTAKELPSQKELLELFRYQEDTGRLFWKDRPQKETESKRGYGVWKSLYCNKEAGYTHFANGYIEVRIPSGELHKAHRIVWKMKTGEDPHMKLDHINGNTTDNRIENLRLATDQENARNSIGYSGTGYKGVSEKRSKEGMYVGFYTIKDQTVFSSQFNTPEEAAMWYDEKVFILYGDYAKLNFPENFKRCGK